MADEYLEKDLEPETIQTGIQVKFRNIRKTSDIPNMDSKMQFTRSTLRKIESLNGMNTQNSNYNFAF